MRAKTTIPVTQQKETRNSDDSSDESESSLGIPGIIIEATSTGSTGIDPEATSTGSTGIDPVRNSVDINRGSFGDVDRESVAPNTRPVDIST